MSEQALINIDSLKRCPIVIICRVWRVRCETHYIHVQRASYCHKRFSSWCKVGWGRLWRSVQGIYTAPGLRTRELIILSTKILESGFQKLNLQKPCKVLHIILNFLIYYLVFQLGFNAWHYVGEFKHLLSARSLTWVTSNHSYNVKDMFWKYDFINLQIAAGYIAKW